MPKICYAPKRFNTSSQLTIGRAESILDEYEAQGFTLTLRQLYYQFVARGLLDNKQSEYKRLGSIISNARLAGLIDWNRIEDRTRSLRRAAYWRSGSDILAGCAAQFRHDLWKSQPYRVEVWIEKDALLGVIEPACDELRLPYFACRGYSSQSEQWRAGRRFEGYRDGGQKIVILHLGDHDPSGLDMTRDNDERLSLFTRNGPITVRRIALNWNQIEEHRPPPNPAKLTDSRAGDYIAQFGDECWELDALEPRVIDGLIRQHAEEFIDWGLWEDDLEGETNVRQRLETLADEWED